MDKDSGRFGLVHSGFGGEVQLGNFVLGVPGHQPGGGGGGQGDDIFIGAGHREAVLSQSQVIFRRIGALIVSQIIKREHIAGGGHIEIG